MIGVINDVGIPTMTLTLTKNGIKMAGLPV